MMRCPLSLLPAVAVLCCAFLLQPSLSFSTSKNYCLSFNHHLLPKQHQSAPSPTLAYPIATSLSRLRSTASPGVPVSDDESNNNDDNDNSSSSATTTTSPTGMRGRLRQMTGFSLTAFRASVRAITGISLTAIYVATLTATGAWIRQTTKVILGILPPPLRYFVQPILILYYAPLFILRNLSAPQNRAAAAASSTSSSNDVVAEGWKAAVTKAENTVSYWPTALEEDDNADAESISGDKGDASDAPSSSSS